MDHLPRLDPMLAVPGALPARQADWGYEVKWDGMRTLAYLPGRADAGGRAGAPLLRSRSGRDVSAQYPELAVLADLLPTGTDGILDGEIVVLGEDGTPSFGLLQERMNLTRPAAVRALADARPVTLMVFDLLWLGGARLTARAYRERRATLAELAVEHPRVRVPPYWEGAGTAAWEWTRRAGLEGVVAKRLTSPYRPGVRSHDWVKVKHVRTVDVVIGGWVPEGPRAVFCQSLLVGLPEPDGGLRYVGRVGTGFTDHDRRRLAELLRQRARESMVFTGNLRRLREETPRLVRWVRPELGCEVAYSELTSGGHLRHPVWRGMREVPGAGDGTPG